MKTIKMISVLIIVFAICAYIIVKATLTHIPVGIVGVRTQEYALIGKKGVVQEDFSPGWHRALWPIDSWQYFDSTVQTLEMTRDPKRGDRKGRDDVQVQSADGYAVSVDVTIKYRIEPGKAHKLYVDTGSGIRYKAIVRNEAEKTCIAQFGGMKTEDFSLLTLRIIASEEQVLSLETCTPLLETAAQVTQATMAWPSTLHSKNRMACACMRLQHLHISSSLTLQITELER